MQLTKKHKAKVKVCFATLIVALLIERIGKQLGLDSDRLPVLSQCTTLIDDILTSETDIPARDEIIKRIQINRSKLTTKIRNLDAGTCLIAAIEYYTGSRFKSKPGTRLDYIRSTLKENAKQLSIHLELNEEHAVIFKKEMDKLIMDSKR